MSFEGERPGFIAASERGLAALPRVRAGHVHVVCCEAGKVTVYVGVERDGAQSFVFYRHRRANRACRRTSCRPGLSSTMR